MSLIEFIQNNITGAYGPFIQAIMLGICFVVVYDFYHLLFSAICTWFKK